MKESTKIWEDVDFLIEHSSVELVNDIMKRQPDSIPRIISSLLQELREYRAAKVQIISSLDDDMFNSDF